MGPRFMVLALVCGASLLPGCAHSQLRWNTTHQAKSLTDIYEQQVLDNLAMFIHDPNSLPFFSTPSTGSSQVTDQGSMGSDLTFKRAIGLDTGVLKLFGQRSMLESWSLSPVSDPRRLELMRCAYQDVVASCGIGSAIGACPDCEKLRNKFHLGSAKSQKSLIQHSQETGKTTPACLAPVCWFGFGCEKCVASHGKCCKSGTYCGTYVWLLPNGQDELSKLTLVILDYALNQPAAASLAPTVEAEFRLKADGTPVENINQAATIIRATLNVDGELPQYRPPRAMTDDTPESAARSFLDQIRGSVIAPQPVERFQPPHPVPDIYQQQLNLRAVTPPPLQP
jgi:hypothetical protein